MPRAEISCGRSRRHGRASREGSPEVNRLAQAGPAGTVSGDRLGLGETGLVLRRIFQDWIWPEAAAGWAGRMLGRVRDRETRSVVLTACGLGLLGMMPPLAAMALDLGASAAYAVCVLSCLAVSIAAIWAALSRRRDDALFRVVTENMPDMVVHHDGEGRMHYVSPQSTALTGHDPQVLLGRTLHAHLHPADWRSLEQLFEDARLHGVSACLDVRIRHGDGSYRWVELRAAPLCGEGGDGTGRGGTGGGRTGRRDLVVSYRAVDGRKAREAEMRMARDSAEMASEAKTRFLASVSHELRTPLNSIIGFSEVMREQMFGPLGSSRYQEYSDYIHESGKHLLDLINDILDMSKIEAGRYELKLESVRMPLVIERCLKTIAYSARQNGLRLDVDMAPTVPSVTADPRALRQILLNLLSNAIKFTPEGGNVRITLGEEQGWVVLGVSDTGIGIPRDAIGRLGRPFEQIQRSVGFDGVPAGTGGPAGTGLPGTGLGLAIVKGLVGLHDGTVIIESEEGEGTTVLVRLPAKALPGRRRPEDERVNPRMARAAA